MHDEECSKNKCNPMSTVHVFHILDSRPLTGTDSTVFFAQNFLALAPQAEALPKRWLADQTVAIRARLCKFVKLLLNPVDSN